MHVRLSFVFMPWDLKKGVGGGANSIWNFNLANNFWTVSARALLWVPKFLTWDLDLGVCCIFLKTLTLLITFEQWVLNFWYFTWVCLVTGPFCGWPCNLGVWPTFENFNLVKYFTFEQWMIEFSYFTQVTRSLCGYQHFYPVTSTLGFRLPVLSKHCNLVNL